MVAYSSFLFCMFAYHLDLCVALSHLMNGRKLIGAFLMRGGGLSHHNNELAHHIVGLDDPVDRLDTFEQQDNVTVERGVVLQWT